MRLKPAGNICLMPYIQRMFVRREVDLIYSARQTIRWLQWLASRLIQSGQTIFLIERMQPDWLQTSGQNPSRLPLIMLLGGPLYGLISGLIVGLILVLLDRLSFGLNLWLNVGLFFRLSNGPLGGLRDGLSIGLFFGLVGGLFDGLSGGFRKISPIEQSGILRRKLKSSLYSLLFWALGGGLLGRLSGGLSGELVLGLIFGLLGGLLGIFREIELVKQLNWSWQRIKGNLYFWLLFGLSLGLIGWLLGRLNSGLGIGLLIVLMSGLFFGVFFVLLGGLIGGLIFQPSTRTELLIGVETQTPNQGIRLSVRYALVTSLIFGIIVGLVSGLIGGLGIGLTVGLISGLIGGLIGSGADIMKHCILRFTLWWQCHIPWNYARFLDYATALIFLRKVGGGYIFVHRLIMEHFAGLDEKEIERIAKSSNFR